MCYFIVFSLPKVNGGTGGDSSVVVILNLLRASECIPLKKLIFSRCIVFTKEHPVYKPIYSILLIIDSNVLPKNDTTTYNRPSHQ